MFMFLKWTMSCAAPIFTQIVILSGVTFTLYVSNFTQIIQQMWEVQTAVDLVP